MQSGLGGVGDSATGPGAREEARWWLVLRQNLLGWGEVVLVLNQVGLLLWK